jgi:hypothetical protein
LLHLPNTFPGTPIFNINNKVIPGGFYFECIWVNGPLTEANAFKPHRHDFDEYVGFIGSDASDPFNLNAEIEIYLDDEKHTINRSCIIYIPKGLWHTPIFARNVKKPIFCFSTSPTQNYGQHVSQDPKWAHMSDPPEDIQA